MRVRDRGFALAIVLVAVIGVFALAMQSAVMSRSATIEARVLRERAECERAAASAATLVLLALTGNDFSGRTGPGAGLNSSGNAPGSKPPSDKPDFELPPIIKQMLGDKANDLEGGARDETDGQSGSGGQPPRSADGGGITGRVKRGARVENEVSFDLPAMPIKIALDEDAPAGAGLTCRVWLSDAIGGLCVNSATEEEIEQYFKLKVSDPLTARSIIDELLDWRDEDNFLRPRGAEIQAYELRGVSCRNGPLVSREELLFLPSMTREIFESIRDDIALDSDGRVHAGSASREVLASIPGMTNDVLDAILKLRDQGKLTEESLAEVIPLSGHLIKDRLRVKASAILRLRVEVTRGQSDTGFTYEGLAVAGSKGVRAMGLKPL